MSNIQEYVKKILTPQEGADYVDSREYGATSHVPAQTDARGRAVSVPTYGSNVTPSNGIIDEYLRGNTTRATHHKAIHDYIWAHNLSMLERMNTTLFTFSHSNQNLWLPEAIPRFLELGRIWRENKGHTLNINSAFRRPGHRYYSNTSAHGCGIAGDLSSNVNNRSHDIAQEIADLAFALGFGGIAIGRPNTYFVHVDLGRHGRWDYGHGIGTWRHPSERR